MKNLSPSPRIFHFVVLCGFALCQSSTTCWSQEAPPKDFLIDASSYVAEVVRDEENDTLCMENGLVRRAWKLAPNGACVALDNLMTGQSMLRSVRPEAKITVDGICYDVGGLVGQPNHAYLTEDFLAAMQSDLKAMQLENVVVGEPTERFHWKRRRHHAPNIHWPPPGAYVRFDYALSSSGQKQIDRIVRGGGGETKKWLGGRDNQTGGYAPPSDLGRKRLILDQFESLDGWQVQVSTANPRSSIENEGKPGEIYTPANTAAYLEREFPKDAEIVEVTLDVGTDTSSSWGPGIAVVYANRTLKFNIRPRGNAYDNYPLLGLWDGQRENPRLGGRMRLDTSKPWTLRLRLEGRTVYCDAKPEEGAWKNYGKAALPKNAGAPLTVRIGKMDQAGGNSDHADAGDIGRLRLLRFSAYGPINVAGMAELQKTIDQSRQIRVSVHYELYDGIPAFSKWITVYNGSDREVTVDSFAAEELALVEHSNWVEYRDGVAIPNPDYLHVETDFAFGGFNSANANRHVVHWRTDPLYTTQVNYARQTPCRLVVEPTYGPAQKVAAGEEFKSFRVYELVYDDGNRERRGLALRRFYRTLAPWVTENPVTHHLLSHDPERVRQAIDEAVAVGFEAIILSFGSGFNMEQRDQQFLRTWREVADYAEEQGIELGCYSLFSSRGVAAEDMIVSPDGQRPTHGQCPAVTSPWGQHWLATMRDFYQATGFDQFENDGPYPGDVDVTSRPPLQQGVLDSRWLQWRDTVELYRDLRGMGIYINAPDYYYLNGTNKCGMGYREVNWSLPRAQQVIHTRQNIYDGTWKKTPSMGWMFVPLSQYHGGGAAATIEPLHDHLDHYRRMLQSNLGMGVQAHYRGPRLFDSPETKELVKEQVDWFKQHRDILESDIVHGRRADGRDLDWVLHVNPKLETPGMLCVYNPLDREVTRHLSPSIYYTGLNQRVMVRAGDGRQIELDVDDRHRVTIEVTVPAGGMSWYTINPSTP
ncbi:hypothetical protein NG895_28040 [Aeoliella sp. ICT_H6.2]|uniref:Alpha-galactosidase n=1 Tax=Aeoliella straminimaris TaxID=2954799 RepID=A0A9X2JK79_9BACT|nr:hypothetical protein [Aeoliella straminimaris]MCO6047773.1 hypothetical protein [Aeoliella straminimaris]